MQGIQKISDRIIGVKGIKHIGIIGDPGCDGLGTYNLQVFGNSLRECKDMDMILIVGDLVPTGEDKFYKLINGFISHETSLPVFVLPGNHDTGDYEEYYGLTEYAIISDSVAIIVLNNMYRGFTDNGMNLVKEVLDMPGVNKAYIAFHIPLPNSFSGNSVPEVEANRLLEAIGDNKGKVSMFLCGHVHSRFEATVWDIPMICTGGGGAFIEDVSEEILATQVNHHVVKLDVEKGIRIVDLNSQSKENQRDSVLANKLLDSVQDEMMAHLRYTMYADRAKDRGLEDLSRAFRALAASEYHHARNFYSLLDCENAFGDSIQEFVKLEEFEYTHLYNMLLQYAKEKEDKLSEISYLSARIAEESHAKLLSEIDKNKNYKGGKLYVCPVCGHLMEEEGLPERCPVCGRPGREFEEF